MNIDHHHAICSLLTIK